MPRKTARMARNHDGGDGKAEMDGAPDKTYDLLIIGGGINGVGIARGAGRRTIPCPGAAGVPQGGSTA